MPGADHPHADLTHRIPEWEFGIGEGPVDAEVHVHGQCAFVVVEQVLAPRVGVREDPSVHRRRTVGETPLGAGHPHRCTRVPIMVQPSEPVQDVSFGHRSVRARYRGCVTGLLVLGEDVDATLVPILVRPLGREEGVDDRERLFEGMHPAADTDQLGVVVLAGKLRGLDAPRQRAARTGDLVRGDLLAVTAAAEDEPEAPRIGNRATGGSMQNAG